MELDIASAADLEAFGGRLAACLSDGLLIFLRGPLGAGKTTLARAVLHALGHEGTVKSPTYTLVETYRVGGHTVHHLDLYRVADPGELEYLGVAELLDGVSLCLIEWPEHGLPRLPRADLEIAIAYRAPGRRLRLTAHGPAGDAVLSCIGMK